MGSWVRAPGESHKKRKVKTFLFLFCVNSDWILAHLQTLGDSFRILFNSRFCSLSVFSYFLLVVCIPYFLVSKSNKKLGTRKKSSQLPFAQVTESEPSVGHLFATSGLRLFSGCCGTRSTRLFEIIYTRVTLKQFHYVQVCMCSLCV